LQKEYAWAVAVGAIGIFLTLVYGIMMKMGMSEGAPGHVVVVLLFVSWFCGMAVCTMELPFAGVAGNGATAPSYTLPPVCPTLKPWHDLIHSVCS